MTRLLSFPSAGFYKPLALLIILLATVQPLFAQVKKPVKPAVIEVPEPIKRIDKLLGKWEGNVHSETGPVVTSKEMKVSFDFSKMFNNQVVKISTRTEWVDTNVVKEGNIVLAYDASEKKMHAMMINDDGHVFDLTAQWMNDYNLNFSCNTERDGKSIGITIWMNIKVPDELGYKMYTTIGGDLLITDEGKLHRKKNDVTGADKKIPVKK